MSCDYYLKALKQKETYKKLNKFRADTSVTSGDTSVTTCIYINGQFNPIFLIHKNLVKSYIIIILLLFKKILNKCFTCEISEKMKFL